MTREEAIDYLAVMYERSREGKRVYHNKYQDAFDMAIDALKCSEIPNSSDTISRQAAIDAIQGRKRG